MLRLYIVIGGANMKIESRGRAKFRPNSEYDNEKIKELLLQKISEEQLKVGKFNGKEKPQKYTYNSEKLNVVSLFSGCGGLDLGFELAGLDILFGKEYVNSIYESYNDFSHFRNKSMFHTIFTNDMFKEANQTYRRNFPEYIIQQEKDIRQIDHFPDCDLVLGGFPCPGFSEAGPRLIDDERNFLYIHFIRCLVEKKPLFFVAENVKGLLTLGKGEVAKQIIQDFESAGYKVKYELVNARDYGIPQIRQRVFIVGVREDIDFEYTFPNPTHGAKADLLPFVTLDDAIRHLEDDPGEWYEGSFSSMYLSRNRKKAWNDQSFTIQASGRQAPLHPSGMPMKKVNSDEWILPGNSDLHRRLSIKEIACIQTFPEWFSFSHGTNQNVNKNGKLDKVYKQIGNAVPVELARVIAQPIAQWAKANVEKLNNSRVYSQQLSLFE